MRLKIKVPATTSNIGPGFDCLGLALTLFNEFYFEKAKEWEFVGFNTSFANTDNLVCQAIKKTYQFAKQDVPCFKITIIQCIPIARGLGSSASCIVAGILAANYFLNNRFNQNDLLNIATIMEGHPDNAAPALFGSLVASYIHNDEVKYVKYEVNENLRFTCAIPNFPLNTKTAREALPKNLSYHDAIYNMSRIVNLPHALKEGNLNLLFELMNDKMHEPYRFPLISESNVFKDISIKNKIPFCISGSGSTLLFISKENILPMLVNNIYKNKWEFTFLNVSKAGATVESIL